VKIDKLANFLIVVLLLSSPLVGAESKYPAADFKPKVVYQDTDYKHTGSSSASSSKSVSRKSVADPKYPAANFQPEVLYQDKNYKPSETSSGTTASSSESNASDDQVDGGSAIPSEMLGVIVLVLAGLVFYIKRSKFDTQPSGKKAERSTNENGTTGVAAYLSRKMPKLSGVDKYLESRENFPSSGVAKYMAKKVVSIKEAAVLKKTGVEKYVRKQS
jgi:hypothetical protein